MKDAKIGLVLMVSMLALSACNESATDNSTECNYAIPKCSADGTALLKCENGVELSTACQCSNGACASNPTGNTCDYTGSKCNGTGTALLTCENGNEKTTPCTCVNNACSTQPTNPCSYTGSRCNADGTALMTCTNGMETSKACSCANNACQEDKGCDYEGSKCNADGTALLTCSGGKETSKACTCSNNACAETPAKDCDYVGSKCSEDGTRLLTCSAEGTETSQVCSCADGACVTSPTQGCTYTEPKCSADGKSLLTCTVGVESTTVCDCEDGACKSETPKCDYTDPKCSDDKKSLMICSGGVESIVNCECDNGLCKSNPTVTCDYTAPKCNADGTALLSCIDGVEAIKKCECADDKCKDEGPVVPRVSGMTPNSGEVGTLVTITGSNLDNTSKVCFAAQCVAPASKKNDAVTAKAPEGTGKVPVKVIIGENEMIAGTFDYIVPEPNKIDWCRLNYVQASLTPDDRVEAYAEVYEAGITGKNNKHEGIYGQVGYISVDSASLNDPQAWSWSNAALNKEFKGDGFEANDEYMNTTLKLAEGTYRVAFRFSLDNQHWTNCDYDGSNGTFNVDRTGLVTVAKTVVPPKPTVSKCYMLNAPKSIESTTGNATEPIYAMGKVEDCTKSDQHCADLDVEIGYGPNYLTDTAEIGSKFTWKKASQNASYDGSEGKDMEQFASTLTSVTAGDYNILYRMSVDKGSTWTYCDRFDDAGFSAKDGVAWSVKDATQPDPEPEKKTVEWCKIQSPSAMTVRANHDSEEVYGRVFVNGCTGTKAGCEGLKAQFGYGPASQKVSEFTYVDAVFNPDAYDIGYNDEYAAYVKPTKAGDYAYVYRFSLDGEDWTYCDNEGIMGSELSKAGKMTVEEDVDKIAWCRIQHPAHISAQVGEKTEEIYGQVLVEGCTGKEKGCKSITAQVGYGAVSEKDPSKFTFTNAEYNVAEGDNDEYAATLNPTKEGEYSVVYRFSADNKKTWTYCDFDNEAGFDIAKASTMTVQKKDEMKISWCQFFTTEFENDTISAVAGTDTAPIYGQAFVSGCTEPDGQCSALTAYIGYGDKSAATPDEYTFVPVSYVKSVGFNDEFAGPVNVKDAGEYGLVYAFSLDGGKTMTYCGNKDKTEFSMSDIATLKINKEAVEGKPMVAGVDYSCGIDNSQASIEVMAGSPRMMYGQIYIKGCTEGKRCDRVSGAHFHYISKYLQSSNPIDTSDKWTIVDAAFNTAYTGTSNNEYMANVTFADANNYKYAYSFDLRHDASDVTEKPQRVFCFVNWETQFGDAVVRNN